MIGVSQAGVFANHAASADFDADESHHMHATRHHHAVANTNLSLCLRLEIQIAIKKQPAAQLNRPRPVQFRHAEHDDRCIDPRQAGLQAGIRPQTLGSTARPVHPMGKRCEKRG